MTSHPATAFALAPQSGGVAHPIRAFARCGARSPRPVLPIPRRRLTHSPTTKASSTPPPPTPPPPAPPLSSVPAQPLHTTTDGPTTGPTFPAEWDRPGCYAVLDAAGAVQYIELSRRVSASLAWHATQLPATECAAARVVVWDVEQVDGATMSALQSTALAWIKEVIEENGAPPPGNDKRVEGSAWRRRPGAEAKPQRANVGFVDGATDPHAEIKRIVGQNEAVLFMKGERSNPMCGFSARTVETLKEVWGDEKFECVDCLNEERNPGLRQAIKEFSEWPTIPQLYVRKEFVGGADIVHEMKASGDLLRLLD